MAKITLDGIVSGFKSVAKIISNFDSIEDNLNNKVLYRDNPEGEPNQMESELDMNSNRILNLPTATSATEPVTYGQYSEGNTLKQFDGTVVENQLGSSALGNVFTLNTTTFTPGLQNLAVYINGVRQLNSTYVETSTTQITFSTAPVATDEYTFVVNERPVGADSYLASNIIYTRTGGNTNVQNRLAEERVSVKDFGAVGDGVADDTEAIRGALDYINSIGGGTVFLPKGTYRRPDTSRRLYVYSNTTIEGEGDLSVILHDDTDTNPRNDLMYINDATNVTLRNFKVLGTAETYPNETNQSQCISGNPCSKIRIENLAVEGVRYMAFAFSRADDVLFTGCRLKNIVRDGYRATQSTNVRIIGCHAENVADDVVAVSSLPDLDPYDHIGHVISGNTFEQCQGFKLLGIKGCTITGNVFRRMIRNPIEAKMADVSGSEGLTPLWALNISDNVFLDCLGHKGTNTVIKISNKGEYDNGGGPDNPGVNASVFDSNYLLDILDADKANIGIRNINITGNIIGRTLPLATNWSDYGYGQLFDRADVGFFTDPEVTEDFFKVHFVSISGKAAGCNISNNTFFGLSQGYSVIQVSMVGSANFMDLDDCLIQGNVVTDCAGPFLGIDGVGSGANAKQVHVYNNILNFDPFLRHTGHNADNTWATNGTLPAINNLANIGILCGGNVFKNCGTTGINNTEVMTAYPNTVYAEYDTYTSSATNKGVRQLPSATNNNIIDIDGDPASATYGQVQNMPRKDGTAMPTSGKYVAGHIVKKSNPVVAGSGGSQYIITGWYRLTTGTGHVLNTDWAEMRTLTGT